MSFIAHRIEDGIGYLGLNNPKTFNALSSEMALEIIAKLRDYDADPNVKVIVMYGEGKVFSAGGDITQMKGIIDNKSFKELEDLAALASMIAKTMRDVLKPIIAKVHGTAAGAGCSMALLADYRVVSEEVKFIEAFVNLGLVPDTGGTYALSKHVGAGKLMEFLTFGEPIPAETAYNLGMVNVLCKAEELDEATKKLAKKIMSKPLDAIKGIKAFVNASIWNDLDHELRLENIYQGYLASGKNFAEGVNAFLEKRKPEFNK